MPFVECNGKRILFIHIPRTGGTSIEAWLSSLGSLRLHSNSIPIFSFCTPQHYRYRDVAALLGSDFFDYAFCIVRNPFKRIESEYRMCAAAQAAGFFETWPTFSVWLDRSLKAYRGDAYYLDNHLRPQWEFLSSNSRVFRFEDGLSKVVEELSEMLGIEAPNTLPHKLNTGAIPVEVVWDRTDRLLVQEVYGRDFTELGYDL